MKPKFPSRKERNFFKKLVSDLCEPTPNHTFGPNKTTPVGPSVRHWFEPKYEVLIRNY